MVVIGKKRESGQNVALIIMYPHAFLGTFFRRPDSAVIERNVELWNLFKGRKRFLIINPGYDFEDYAGPAAPLEEKRERIGLYSYYNEAADLEKLNRLFAEAGKDSNSKRLRYVSIAGRGAFQTREEEKIFTDTIKKEGITDIVIGGTYVDCQSRSADVQISDLLNPYFPAKDYPELRFWLVGAAGVWIGRRIKKRKDLIKAFEIASIMDSQLKHPRFKFIADMKVTNDIFETIDKAREES